MISESFATMCLDAWKDERLKSGSIKSLLDGKHIGDVR